MNEVARIGDRMTTRDDDGNDVELELVELSTDNILFSCVLCFFSETSDPCPMAISSCTAFDPNTNNAMVSAWKRVTPKMSPNGGEV